MNSSSKQALSFEEFEQRCAAGPDLELDWKYWNVLLPETTGRALWVLFIEPGLRELLRVTR